MTMVGGFDVHRKQSPRNRGKHNPMKKPVAGPNRSAPKSRRTSFSSGWTAAAAARCSRRGVCSLTPRRALHAYQGTPNYEELESRLMTNPSMVASVMVSCLF